MSAFDKRIKELEAQLNNYQRTLGDAIEREEKLEAERDRLREALQTIADECEIEFQYAADVANAALKE